MIQNVNISFVIFKTIQHVKSLINQGSIDYFYPTLENFNFCQIGPETDLW